MPAPTVFRPASSSPGFWAARTWNKELLLVLWMHGTADVHGGEDGVDERLQAGDQHLEPVEPDEQRPGQDGTDVGRVEQRRREDGERCQQEVTGEQVGEQPAGPRGGANE